MVLFNKLENPLFVTLWGYNSIVHSGLKFFFRSQNPLNIKLSAATKSFNVLITYIFPRFRTRARVFFAHIHTVPRFKFPQGISYEKVFNLPLFRIYRLIYSIFRKAYLSSDLSFFAE